MISAGRTAPDFSLENEAGEAVSLGDFKGKRIVLYFYPKDDTPGCTREACGFRDQRRAFQRKNTVILGVSGDSVSSHQRFREKFGLPFHLLSDPEKKVLKAYAVWKKKSLYGKKFMGVERSTFIINEKGKIEKVFSKVKVDGHIDEVLAFLK